MKNFKSLFIAITAFIGACGVNAQNCDAYEIQLDKDLQANNVDAAYTMLNKALTDCPSEKINFYNFGETILVDKIEKAGTDAEKKKFASELLSLIDKRLANFPDEKKGFWEGEKINYQLRYGLITEMQAYEAYSQLFALPDEADAQKFSATTATNYFVTAVDLLNAEQIDYNSAMESYFQTKKVADDNIEMRSLEYGILAEKLDSIKQVNPRKDLSAAEKQIMANAQSAKDLFLQLSDGMESALAGMASCENIAPMYEQDYEKNKDNLDWIIASYQALESKQCYDQPIMEKLDKRYVAVWQKNNPTKPVAGRGGSGKSGTIGTAYGQAVSHFNAGQYSKAIASFQKAMDEVSGTTRGDVAYYIALSYQKNGSNSNAVSWAHRAASYKPGYGAPYQLIAGAFAAAANSCGTNEFDKRVAFWVAADFANKACAVDSRSCSWGRSAAKSYEGNAPTIEQAFARGKSPGDVVSVSCLGGASTRVR